MHPKVNVDVDVNANIVTQNATAVTIGSGVSQAKNLAQVETDHTAAFQAQAAVDVHKFFIG